MHPLKGLVPNPLSQYDSSKCYVAIDYPIFFKNVSAKCSRGSSARAVQAYITDMAAIYSVFIRLILHPSLILAKSNAFYI